MSPLAWLPLAAFALLLAVAAAAAAGILDDGSTRLGINADATLGVPGSASSGTGTTNVALRLAATNAEGVGASCLCEGWGLAHDGVSAWTAANGSRSDVLVGPATETGTTADLSATAAGLAVRHAVAPAADPRAFRIDVTVTNPGPTTVTGLLYRRVADWSVEPRPGSESVTLHAALPVPAWLAYTSDDGRALPDPMRPRTAAYATGPPSMPDAVDVGPADHGVLAELSLGCLGPGDSATFTLLYGAAADEAAALSALVASGAQAWSLAEPGSDAATGTPQTFFLGLTAPDTPLCVTPSFTATFTTTAPMDYAGDVVRFADATSALPAGASVAWSFGDAGTAIGPVTLHTYARSGTYTACERVTVPAPGSSATRTWTACTPITVRNRPPVAAFTAANVTADAVRFTDAAFDLDGTVASRSWTLGDGATVAPTSGAPFDHAYPRQGTYRACLTVTDDEGAATRTCQDIAAPGAPNRPPLVYPIPSKHVTFGSRIDFQVRVIELDGDAVSFAADGLPAGASLDPATGRFSWLPAVGQTGLFSGIRVRATDPYGAVGEREAVILIDPVAGDSDHDGIADDADNCPSVGNPDQVDADGDLVGDACIAPGPAYRPDPALLVPLATPEEARAIDACLDADALDRDRDGAPDVCDPDVDGDGVPDHPIVGFADNCPLVPNADQTDSDGDGTGDVCALPAAALAQARGAQGGDAAAPAQPADGTPATADAAQLAAAGAPRPAAPALTILGAFAAAGALAGLAVGGVLRRRRA